MGINVKISNKWSVESNSNQYMLMYKTYSEETKKYSKINKGNYSNLTTLFNELINKEIMNSSAKNMRQLLEIVEACKKDINKVLEPLVNIELK